MNFLVLGSPLLLFMLNYDWTTSYFIKLVGALLTLVGIIELKSEFKGLLKLKKATALYAVFCGVSAGCIAFMKFFHILGSEKIKLRPLGDLLSLALWAGAVFFGLYISRQVYNCIDKERENLSDTVGLVRLGYTLTKVIYLTVFTYVSNVIYILLPYRQTADFFAVLMMIGKICLYVLIIVYSVRFFRVRTSYYQKENDN